MKNLISLEQYIDDREELYRKKDQLSKTEFLLGILDLNKALKQPPQLNHFVPAVLKDGNWRVLEKPNKSNPKYETKFSAEDYFDSMMYEIDCNEYETALNDVLFDGFEVKYYNLGGGEVNNQSSFEITNGEVQICYYKAIPKYFTWNFKSYSDLTKYNLTLNEKGCEKFKL